MKIITAVVILGCLLVVEVKGQARAPKGRCFCAGKGVNMVPPKLIEKVEIIPPSPSCKTQEIVVTLKNSTEQKCLNPESKFTQKYIMKAVEKRSLQKKYESI
ncbi:C-X-C motif chemokine 11 [Sinocyclocheilus rhinocerous]|uniref:C-X-C motif chemokine 11-like n=1 Tax=Sinocyclocheilus rhinocerous TaxID=307959 RepID=A0A673LQE1_9TELE|nr:PREDICTED: C-X-C motif chemokine 11-like [Sinocyclocheilus rhinocerous]